MDGLADVVVAHGGWYRVSAFPQENNGTLGGYALYALPDFSASHYKPQGLVNGDMNNDSLPDVLLADYNYGLFVFPHSPVIPSEFSKSNPLNNKNNQPFDPVLTWGTSIGATSYQYCYDTTNDDQCDDAWISNGNNKSITLSNLNPSTTYYWQVQAINSLGSTYSNGGAWWAFTTHSPILTKTFKSAGSKDGYIFESAERSNLGGSFNSTAWMFRLGDDSAKRQYRSILSFATGPGLPDNAVITKVTLMIKKQFITGGNNPFTIFDGLLVDIRKGFFGSDSYLAANDFHLPANKTLGSFFPTAENNWYSIELTTARGNINKLETGDGVTQFRLRFKLDDNNNVFGNYISFFSGNGLTGNRPRLIIQYYVP